MLGSYTGSGYMYYYSCFSSTIGANGSYTAYYDPGNWMFLGFSAGQITEDSSSNVYAGTLYFHSNLGDLYLENTTSIGCGSNSDYFNPGTPI